jgi:hypothetical protein
VEPVRAIAKTFLSAWCARDFDRLEACLDPDVRFRALVGARPFGSTGAHALVDTLRKLFAALPFEVRRADVETTGDGLRFSFLFLVPPDGDEAVEAHVVEQLLFADLAGDRIASLELVASCYSIPAVTARQKQPAVLLPA